MQERKRALVWAAVSTKQQAEDAKASIPSQIEGCQAWCQVNGYDVLDTLIIDGFSRRFYTLNEFAQALLEAQRNEAGFKLLEYIDARAFDVFVCRDVDRFGREQSIVSELIQRVIHSGALIYTLNEGWITEQQARIVAAMSGYRAAAYVDDLRRKVQMGKTALVKRGLPLSGRTLPCHKLIRDERNGKAVKVVFDESTRPEWEALAALLLEGVPYMQLQDEMFKRHGYGKVTKPYTYNHYYRLLHHPAFWGHVASPVMKSHRYSWVWRDDVEPPEGVTIYRHMIEPVYTGDQAAAVIAELDRRISIKGSSSPRSHLPLRGLFVCADCGHNLGYTFGKGGHGLVCKTRYISPSITCSNRSWLSEKRAKVYITGLLERMLEEGTPSAFIDVRHTELELAKNQLKQAEHGLEKVETELRQAVRLRAKSDASIHDIYDEHIDALTAQRKAASIHLKQCLERLNRVNVSAQQQASYDEISSIGVDGFWLLPPPKQNRLLHALMSEYRIFFHDREILGIGIPPNRKRQANLSGRA